MVFTMEKLTDIQIIEMEKWAENKKNTNMTAQEKSMVERIEGLKKQNWKGCRANDIPINPVTKEDAQKGLDFLKLRQGKV